MKIEEQVQILEDICPAFTHHVSKRKIRHSFFKSIKTEIQAYLLGFFIADGSIDQKRKTFRVQLNENDSEIIELYKEYISKDARIFKVSGHCVTGRNGETYQQKGFIGIDITSSELTESLVNLGYGYRKTYSQMNLPQLNDELMIHLIRGYFDGDGSITSWYVPADKIRKERIRSIFMIDCKNNVLLLDIQKFLSKFDISTNITFLNRDQMYRISTGSRKELEKLYNLLYKNANFFLKRKYNKFNHYVNTEVTQLIAEYRNAQKVSVNESNNPSKSVEHPIQDENVR